jgi:PAP2 superfamily
MPFWVTVALAYFLYLSAVACLPAFRHARVPAFAALLGLALIAIVAPELFEPRVPLMRALVPIPVLLTCYWVSGRFYLGPMIHLERWLLAIDRAVIERCDLVSNAPTLRVTVAAGLELAYLLVYLMVPAGAVTLVLGGHDGALDRFWSVVLLAACLSYGALPWLQTRPPRDPAVGDHRACDSPVRRLNLHVLSRASNQVNTIPSGHTATAVATAVVLVTTMPYAGAAFALLAVAIAVATIVGRYHYVADSVAGALVAVVAWAVARAWLR